jgi:glycosyltransferase involved in cell wall biosynthesis
MKLSVVVPAHNERESIGATLEALSSELGAHDIPYEILVIDDASNDGT